MQAAFWIIGIAIALFALDRLFLWMEAKGWVYWRKKKGSASGGGALTGMNVFEPGARYLEEAREERTLQEDEDDGDDDEKRKPDDQVS